MLVGASRETALDPGIELIEIAPGIDLEMDILRQMDFCPQINPQLKLMDSRLFCPGPMGIEQEISSQSSPVHARVVALG